MGWKDGKIVKLLITSLLGGNCRLRSPNELTGENNAILKPTASKNSNPYYYTDKVKQPLSHTYTQVQKCNKLAIKQTLRSK
jgi:alpha-L-fucosidase 2